MPCSSRKDEAFAFAGKGDEAPVVAVEGACTPAPVLASSNAAAQVRQAIYLL